MAKYKKERPVVARIGEELATRFGHRNGVSAIAFQIGFEVIDRFRGDVILADLRRSITGSLHHSRQRQADHVVERGEFVVVVLVAELSVAMVVQARSSPRCDWRCRRPSSQRHCERSVRRGPPRRSPGVTADGIAIATKRGAFVVGNDEQNVPFGGPEFPDAGKTGQNRNADQRKQSSHGGVVVVRWNGREC